MNVTPLVDVVLVLLIIFMVITPMLARKLWLRLPEKPDDVAAPAPDERPPVVLSLGEDGAIRVNREAVSDADLPDRLRRIFGARRDHTLFFSAHDDAEYGDAMHLMDRAREGGASTIAVITEPLAD
jgi:biopolymer transport protein ExbD/biopolymer transport protein TolR